MGVVSGGGDREGGGGDRVICLIRFVYQRMPYRVCVCQMYQWMVQ